MKSSPATTAEAVMEAAERLNIVSFLEEIRGTAEFDRQRVIDLLSAIATLERGGTQMYQQYSQQTNGQEYKGRWQEFARETAMHAQVADRVIGALGGDPGYRSPAAMELEKAVSPMLKIEARGDVADLTRLGYLVMVENVFRHQWRGVNSLARRIKDPGVAKILWDASRIVERDEEEHVRWNTVAYDSQFEKVATGM